MICLNPKLSFTSLMSQEPKKLIFTSGTLPRKDIMENLLGLKFQKSDPITQIGWANRCFLSLKSRT